MRFAFLKGLEYPLYYDSAVHYQIVSDLQNQSGSLRSGQSVLNLTSQRYYHVGFHSTVLVLAVQLKGSFDDAQLILITGHVFLIVFVLNLGLLASRLFNNFDAGISTIVFASLGWTMPAFAMNWGKYPAISSLAIFPLAIYWMINSYRSTDQNRSLHILLCGISSLCAILLHSRSLILLGCGLAAMATLEMIWKRLSRDTLKVFVYGEIVLLLGIIHFHPNFQTAFSPYLRGVDLIATVWALASLLFIARQNTKIAIGILTFMLYLLIISMIPTPEFLVSQAGRYLVDRPFLQLLLVSPLSLFAGSSFSYLIGELHSRLSGAKNGIRIVGMGLVSLALLLIMIRPGSDFKPNPCCIYMTVDDTFLIGWMEANVPPTSQILISTDADFNTRFVKVATDAGAWITPLTKLKTIKFDYRTDFSDPALHQTLCQENIKYIYVSLVNTSFSIPLLEKNQQNYSAIIVLPEARLYRVDCH